MRSEPGGVMLFVRDILRMPDKRQFRIIGVVDQEAVLFDLGASRTRLERADLATLARGVDRNKIVLVTDAAFNRTGVDASPAQLERASARHRVVCEILSAGVTVFDRAARGHLVAKAAKDHGLTPATVHDALFAYWKRGMTRDALLPAFDRCGGAGVPRGGTATLGRKGPANAPSAPRLTREILDAFEKGTNRFYRDNANNGLAEAFRLICDDLLTECVFDSQTGTPLTFVKQPRDGAVLPTLRQYRYWYSKQKRARADAAARMPDAKYQMRHRARLSYAAQDNENIGGRYIIDSTPLDLNLVSRLSAATFLSTPTLYLVTDEFTGFITGFSLSLEDASWTAAGLALLNAVEDKVAFCAQYGIEIAEDDWPVSDLVAMRQLYDKGEAKGSRAEQFGIKSSLIIENTASYRGDLKGIGEQRFDLINEALRGKVPGYRVKASGTRGEDDPRLDAILDLIDAVSVVIHAILFLNRSEIATFRRSRAMIEEGVPPIPLEMWKWAMRTGRTALMRRSFSEMLVALLPTDTATITQQGLCYKGLYYSCETAERERWFEFVARPARLRKVTISYHPWLVDMIYVHDAAPDQVEVAALTPHSARFSGISFEELERLNEAERGKARNRQVDQTHNHATFSNNVKRIVAEAATRRYYRLRPRDLGGAREARTAEREFEREDHRETMRAVAASLSTPGQLRRLPSPDIMSHEDLGEGRLPGA